MVKMKSGYFAALCQKCRQFVTKQHLGPIAPTRPWSAGPGLLLDGVSFKFARVTRRSHEISAYNGARNGYRAVAGFLSRRPRAARAVAQRLPPRTLYLGIPGRARR